VSPGHEGDEDVRLDALFMKDRADRQIPLQVLERHLDFSQLQAELPQLRRIGIGQIRARQISTSRRRTF
jgi:hypothetical protein